MSTDTTGAPLESGCKHGGIIAKIICQSNELIVNRVKGQSGTERITVFSLFFFIFRTRGTDGAKI